MTNIEVQTMEAVKSACRTISSKDIDWEQRRYEIAKEVVGHIERTTAEDIADAAVEIADALIAKLRKTI